jgi:8-oxo-dGTP pyrophosphatase MutT (NUDIX family)
MSECCYSVVGVLIWNDEDQLLMFERNTPPEGIACPAGHIDEHGIPEQAAINEVREEVGLSVTSLRSLWQGYLPYRCRRQGEHGDGGHAWFIYSASVEDEEIVASDRETRNVQWYSINEIGALAHGGKLEPAWKEILKKVGVL